MLHTEEGLAIVLVDVSGTGVSAALLASTLQGMIYSHMVAGMSLPEIVGAVNRFLTHKLTGEKYATLVLARLRHDGSGAWSACLAPGGEIRTGGPYLANAKATTGP